MNPDDHTRPHPLAPIEDALLGYYAVMQEAVQELLIENGVLTAAEIRQAIEAMDERTPAQGARAVARAWTAILRSKTVFSPTAPQPAASSASRSVRPG